jgi:hypothetical protein
MVSRHSDEFCKGSDEQACSAKGEQARHVNRQLQMSRRKE